MSKIKLDERYEEYLDQINNEDLYDQAFEVLMLDNDKKIDSIDEINHIIDVLDSEILLRRRDIIHMYGCVEDYKALINDMINNSDDYEFESEDGVEEITNSIEQLSGTFTMIADKQIELESYIKSREFARKLSNHVSNTVEAEDYISAEIEKSINKN